MFDVIKEILVSEIEFTETNYKILQKKLGLTLKNNLVDSDGGMYLTVDSLIEMDDIMISSNNITLRKVNVNPHEFDKMYKDKKLIEDTFYQITD